jgi:hypothetical protein
MVFQSQIFWGCLGAVIIWIFAWSAISTHVKKRQPYSNPWINKLASNMEVIAILPLIPFILLYALYLRFLFDPLRRSIKGRFVRRNERRQGVRLRGAFGAQRLIWAMEDLEYVRREKMPLVEEVEVVGSDGGECIPWMACRSSECVNVGLVSQKFRQPNRRFTPSKDKDSHLRVFQRSFAFISTAFWITARRFD